MTSSAPDLGRQPSRLPGVNLADAFGGPPARSAGLAGRLAPVRSAPAPAPPDDAAAHAALVEGAGLDDAAPQDAPEPEAAPEPAADAPPGEGGSPAAPAAALRVVIIYIPVSVRDRLKRAAADSGASYTQTVLQSVEAAHDRLGEVVADLSGGPAGGGLFSTPSLRRPRRDEPNVQVSIRVTQSDLDVLDVLTERHSVASRSALVAAALDAHLPR